ncbi:kinase-like domain-containing protein [Suillus occidentalis]|nr:kinase-like domain-containing protein [Suillus occidentalis]
MHTPLSSPRPPVSLVLLCPQVHQTRRFSTIAVGVSNVRTAKLTPIPGLHEAAKTLLAVWDAVDVVESSVWGRTELVRLKQTNQLQCLRLAARCAMAIYSVRAEIADAGIVGIAQEVHGPVMKLNECIEMAHKFLLKLNRRPFIKRFLQSDEIKFTHILKECKRFAVERPIDATHTHPDSDPAQGQGLTPPPIYASPPQTTSSTDPISPLAEFQDPENASDREQDRELFHSTLQRIISARRDDEVLQVLGVRPGEVPEALKAFRRAEEALRDATEKQECDIFEDGLKRVCMETGIEAMTRLSSVAVREPEDKDVDVPWDLPPWTITRKEVEIWRQLKHENVLRMWGASSAQGERPWFIVSEYCSGGSLVSWLKQRKGRVDSSVGGALTPPGTGVRGDMDLLRCMHHISKGMVYLHDQNVLHEDLKASNVLNGGCKIKWEASRRSRKPIANGTLRWQAPELLDGAVNLSKATDVYAFAICCIEILGLGDLLYGHRDDTRVAFLVLEQNKRAEIPSTGITSLVEPLIQECWVRDPEQRPVFTHIAATLKCLRRATLAREDFDFVRAAPPVTEYTSSIMRLREYHCVDPEDPVPTGGADDGFDDGISDAWLPKGVQVHDDL